jgi:hypothetical protein
MTKYSKTQIRMKPELCKVMVLHINTMAGFLDMFGFRSMGEYVFFMVYRDNLADGYYIGGELHYREGLICYEDTVALATRVC